MTNQVPAVDINLIQSLNQRAKQSNTDRSRLLGQKEVAQRQFDQGVAAYKAKYGVDLSTVSIEAEYAAEVERINSEAAALQKQLADIESGAYKTKLPEGAAPTHPAEAQPATQSQPQSQVQAQPPVQAQDASTQPQPTAQPQPTQPEKPAWMAGVPESTPASTPAQPTQEKPSWMVGLGSEAASQSQPQPQPSSEEQDPSEQPFTPQTWGAPLNGGNSEVESTFGQMFGNTPNNGNGTSFGG